MCYFGHQNVLFWAPKCATLGAKMCYFGHQHVLFWTPLLGARGSDASSAGCVILGAKCASFGVRPNVCFWRQICYFLCLFCAKCASSRVFVPFLCYSRRQMFFFDLIMPINTIIMPIARVIEATICSITPILSAS